VALTCAGGPRVSRDVEVAAGTTANLDLRLAPAAATASDLTAPPSAPLPARSGMRRGTIAWIVTGALAVAAGGFYTAALLEARRLDQLRRTYPVTASRLDNQARVTTRLALVGDLFAAGTVVSAGVASYLRWGAESSYRGPETAAARRADPPAWGVSLGRSGVLLQGNF
jgi:hypothetical protein